AVDVARAVGGRRRQLGRVPRRSPQAHPAVAAPTSAVQNAHRRAREGMLLRHSGHSRVGDSTSVWVLRRSIRVLMGRTTKKNTAAAMLTKAISTLRKSP